MTVSSRPGPLFSLITCNSLVSDIAIFVLKRDVKLQLTNLQLMLLLLYESHSQWS